MPEIAIVSADLPFADALRGDLALLGYSVRSHDSLTLLFKNINARPPNLLILDLDLVKEPSEILGALRFNSQTSALPIVAVTQIFASSGQIVAGLRAGAVEYVIKPCNSKVLAARVEGILKAVNRRKGSSPSALRSKDGAVVMDKRAQRCLANSEELSLSPSEFVILSELLAGAGGVIAKNDLLSALWPSDWSRREHKIILSQHIARLRNKLGPLRSRLKTVWGRGYRFD